MPSLKVDGRPIYALLLLGLPVAPEVWNVPPGPLWYLSDMSIDSLLSDDIMLSIAEDLESSRE